MRACLTVILAIVTAMLGCSTPRADRGGFDSPNPAAKLYAIRDAGQRSDRAQIPRLIEQLGSDDPAVRLWTIQALERITGTRMGYNYYGDAAERDAAIRRWTQAYTTGQLNADAEQTDTAARSQ